MTSALNWRDHVLIALSRDAAFCNTKLWNEQNSDSLAVLASLNSRLGLTALIANPFFKCAFADAPLGTYFEKSWDLVTVNHSAKCGSRNIQDSCGLTDRQKLYVSILFFHSTPRATIEQRSGHGFMTSKWSFPKYGSGQKSTLSAYEVHL